MPRRHATRQLPNANRSNLSNTGKASKPDTSFRDSVFSSYTSMKKAAVQLKYVEAKVKLKKQLDAEERVESERQMKIREANREIEMSKRVGSADSGESALPRAERAGRKRLW